MRLLLAALLAFALTAGCNRESPNESVPGVRLGMTPRDVRDRFEPGGEGSWQTRVGGGAGATDDTTLEWSATSEAGRVGHARFEFHLGMLVAVRAHLRGATGPGGSADVSATPKTVTARVAGGAPKGGTDVTILARDCPTHHDEAELLAAKAR